MSSLIVFFAHRFSQGPIGGKIIVLNSSLPSVGPGALKNREDPTILGTSKVRITSRLVYLPPIDPCLLRSGTIIDPTSQNLEFRRNPLSSQRRSRSTNFSPSTARSLRLPSTCSCSTLVTPMWLLSVSCIFFHTFPYFSRRKRGQRKRGTATLLPSSQPGVRLFSSPLRNRSDSFFVPFTGALPKYTAGQTYFYPSFSATHTEDATKFAYELGDVLSHKIGLEAIIRVRASRGELPSSCIILPS